MRLHFGDLSKTEEASPETQGWQVIRSPLARHGYRLAALAGFALLVGLWVGLTLLSSVVGGKGLATAGDSTMTWAVVLVVLVTFIPLHEFLHLLGQPEWGRPDRSVLVVWPAKLRLGIYYEGCMSRRRWLGMRLAPLLALSVLPAGLLILSQVQPLSVELEIGLQVLMVVNALGSGGDLLAVWLVLAQVPPSGQLCFREGRAYWRPVWYR
jgi:hypothetical protein